ncbi:histidine-type phosphatase [Mucilaginibacter sp. L196]|uniref:histidine-type phosphatase n=1 Tax=Mucilaginibacter sp. L196 TaxID=1641870 RepID=UPI00131BC0A8|nr:histidine-type phosphatase [Mucilaginibacter sp. L196]
MKTTILFLLFVIVLPLGAFAQNCTSDFLGTKTLYKSSGSKYTAAPTGYVPVFINHVSRHGARHLTKDVKSTLAYKLLFKADSLNGLTAKGTQLKQMVIALQKIEKGKKGFISAEGKEELRGLGERMYLNYPNVFKGDLNLSIAITKEIRTRQSADAFLKGLNSKLKDTVSATFHNDDVALRFYDLSPAYKNFEDSVDNDAAMLEIEKADDFKAINFFVASRIFTAGFLKQLNEDQQSKFVADIFGFATIVYSLKTEIREEGHETKDLNFESFFTCDELKKLGEMDSWNEDLKKGPGKNCNGIQVRVAVPLLVDFLNTSDEFIKTGKNDARLRFAHAETIAPFAALLQIASADKPIRSVGKSNTNWNTSTIIPLSSNINWVFYKRKGTSNYLVKVLLNEKEEKIDGLYSKSFPYYQWHDLRTFYLKKLERLKVKTSDDMSSYLLQLR